MARRVVHEDPFGLFGYSPLNDTWFVPGDHWKVADADQIADEGGLEDPHVRLADLLVDAAVVDGGRRRAAADGR